MRNLQTITTKELRDNLSEILERVAIGREEFIVSKFGRKKAMVVPVETAMEKKSTSGLEKSFGAWKNKR
jgi:prevent-host-death family protein